MNIASEVIPEQLIYEMIGDTPIYYRGYKDCLNGNKNIDEIMGSSYLQSLIISRLVYFLTSKLLGKYEVLTNEVGLQFKNKGWRAADIAILDNEQLKHIKKNNKYLKIPPKIVIEIDTKAELEEVKDALGYFHKKTDELLEFGVEKVIWIFTDSEKIMIAQNDRPWEVIDWMNDFEVFNGLIVNLEKLLDWE